MYNNIGLASSALGSLLRKAQEQRSQSPLMTPTNSEEGSMIREQVQGPINAPESVGSEKSVAIKPEMNLSPEIAPSVPSGDNIIAPIGPTNGPVTPVESMPSGITSPSQANEMAINRSSTPSVPSVAPQGKSSLPKGTLVPSSFATKTQSSNYSNQIANAPGGNISQGSSNPKASTLAKATGAGSALARGASLVSRAMLGVGGALGTLMPVSILNKAVQSGLKKSVKA